MVYLKITKSNGRIITCELRRDPSRRGRPIPYERALELVKGRKPTAEIRLFGFCSATYDLGRTGLCRKEAERD
jgi:hypothetical protein